MARSAGTAGAQMSRWKIPFGFLVLGLMAPFLFLGFVWAMISTGFAVGSEAFERAFDEAGDEAARRTKARCSNTRSTES